MNVLIAIGFYWFPVAGCSAEILRDGFSFSECCGLVAHKKGRKISFPADVIIE
jgi:hypothetical protein